MTDLVDKLCEILESDSSSESSEEIFECVTPPEVPERKQRDLLLNSYAVYLKGRYRAQNPAFLILQWPPPPTCKVFNLAMILHESIRHGPIDDELVRLTLRGNVDDIMRRKVAVKVKDIIKLDKAERKVILIDGAPYIAERKVILIEGAPGAGKSTLAWHILQKWARGELFQEFDVVIFIQLRDPEVQAAQSLADVLPARDRTAAETMASALRASDGQNTLFVLDSWDEFTPQLRPGSVFEQLICYPESLNLHMSAVLITSRPIASGVLYGRISSRVEIVGFTPTERKQYFTEVLRGDTHKVQKLEDHLSERPVIEASCYLPLNAAIVAHLFLTLNQTLPTTLHGVFTSLVICCLIRHMQRVGREELISSFEDLPEDIQQPFKNICIMAYHGIMENKVTFSASDLQSFNFPTELSTLSLIQGVESLTTYQRTTSYNFLHLSIQELLAAFHISQLPESDQISIFKELFDEPRFAAVFQYYAAFTKLQAKGIRGIIVDIIKQKMPKQQHKEQEDREYYAIRPLRRTELGEYKNEMPPLSLLHCLYEAQELSLCQFVASQLNKGVNYFGASLSPVDCLEVGYFLRSVCLATIGEFKANLTNCSLGDYRVSFLVRELSKSSSSSDAHSIAATGGGAPGSLDLDLSNNEIQGPGVKKIAELLTGCSLIRKLTLGNDNVGPVNKLQEQEDGLYYLLQAFLTNSSLVHLSLRHCSLTITKDNGPVLTRILQTSESLVKLNIGRNDLGDSGIAHISHSLTINTTLRELDLTQCKLTEKGAELLAQVLTVNKSLEIVHLSFNRISDTGAPHLANALRHNHSLKKLDLNRCGIGDPGVISLSTALTVNSTLEELELSWNHFTDTGLVAMSDSLKSNRGLQRLGLGYLFQVTAKGLRQFVLCLQENCHLVELEMGDTADGAETVQHETKLVNKTRRQRGLTELVVTGW